MNDDLTSNPANYSDDALARVLEEIISERAFRGGVSQPDDASMPLEGVCPEPGEWLRILSGEARPAEADALLAHATACRVCAARLRMLSADASQEETAEVGKLASISCEWQHKLAVELARTSNRPAGKRAAWLYLWVVAGLAASLVIIVAGILPPTIMPAVSRIFSTVTSMEQQSGQSSAHTEWRVSGISSIISWGRGVANRRRPALPWRQSPRRWPAPPWRRGWAR